ncbi:MAG: cell division protein FtsL [Acidobacteria bacterium]|nr:cell division protein FtsL [Acidobacteriota bacterium]
MATLSIPNGAAALLNPITARINQRFAPRVVERPADSVPAAMRGTPEIYIQKRIDNSRVVRVVDPRRTREMMHFAGACAALFLFAILYAWQHFGAIEYGYRIQGARNDVAALAEENRQLTLEQAALRDPQRIDQLARNMGMRAPQVGQVTPLEPMAEPEVTQLARAGSVRPVVAR